MSTVNRRLEAHAYYQAILEEAKAKDVAENSGTQWVDAATAELGRTDLFFLLVFLLKRVDADRDWLFDRCREVQASPDGHLDLWSRDHYKSTVITFALTIQDILNNPDVTIGIFSHTKPIAKKFLNQIKREFETNEELKALYPDVLWASPDKESPKWSEEGIIVRRKNNPKEATVEAWGLTDGQPTGSHFMCLIYDDVVTRESVYTPEAITKTTEAYELSLNLGTDGGKRRMIGTRYHARDTYATIMERESFEPRIHQATVGGLDPFKHPDAEPVLLTKDTLLKKRRDMGPYTFSCQMLQNPANDDAMGFRRDWMRQDHVAPKGLFTYILVDAASSKKKTSDFTAMAVVGLGSDEKYYLIDAIRDRMNLTERADALMDLHAVYRPKGVGYEKYGMMSDIEHMQFVMAERNYRFDITEVGGRMPKEDRIRRLIPLFEQGRFVIQDSISRITSEQRRVDVARQFIEDELIPFPNSKHDDLMDAVSRIFDIQTTFPQSQSPSLQRHLRLVQNRPKHWMAA